MTDEKNGETAEPEEAVTTETNGETKKTKRWIALAKVLGAIATVLTAGTGVVIAVWEPGASKAQADTELSHGVTAKTVNRLREAVNALAVTQLKLARRVTFFQAFQEGFNAGSQQAKIDKLQRELSDARGKKVKRTEIAIKLEDLTAKFEADQKRRAKLKKRQRELLKGVGKAVQSVAPMPSKLRTIRRKSAK